MSPAAPPFRLTLLPDGSRATGWRGPSDAPSVWVIGGSFAQGWGVSDDQTFVARLQAAHPTLRFVNLAVPAYGTAQALAGLRLRLREQSPPALVLYGFIEDHARRNVGTPEWVRDIGISRREDVVRFPVCRPDSGGAVECGLSESFGVWPLRDRLAAVALAETWFLHRAVRGRLDQSEKVTEWLLLELARTTSEAGARLVVAMLHGRPQALAHYARFLEGHDVRVSNCAMPLAPGLHLPGDVHPSARGHARYARCLEPALEAALAEIAHEDGTRAPR